MASEYQLIHTPEGMPPLDGVKRVADNAYIPNDPGNRDWAEYQRWLADGNQPDPAPEPQPP